jgi:hypothetical protein
MQEPFRQIYIEFEATFYGVMPLTSIEKLTVRIGNTLLIWSIASIIAGIAMYFFSFDPLLQGIGFQAVLWGVIDLVVFFTVLRRREHALAKIRQELTTSIRLEVIYIIIGLLILIFMGQDPYFAGHGYGIIFQGVFLIGLDLYYYRSLGSFS